MQLADIEEQVFSMGLVHRKGLVYKKLNLMQI